MRDADASVWVSNVVMTEQVKTKDEERPARRRRETFVWHGDQRRSTTDPPIKGVLAAVRRVCLPLRLLAPHSRQRPPFLCSQSFPVNDPYAS